MANIAQYFQPILTAGLLFIPIAALFTLPFMVTQYHRYGSIPILRVLVVYSFILYMMCAFLLTVLPLPDIEKVEKMEPMPIQWIPFSTYITAFRLAGFRLKVPSTWISLACWKVLLRSSNLFEILANIVMQIPLGVFLRYYFRRNWKQVLVIGACVSLFYELTQLSGLYFIYPKAYRLCSIDDLIDNTLGAMIGYWITPLLCKCLPSRDDLDRISIEGERRLTLTRRFTSAVIDWLLFFIGFSFLLISPVGSAERFLTISTLCYWGWILIDFILLQRILRGRSIGKLLLRIAVRDSRTQNTPTLCQLMIRYFWIYGLLPLILFGMTIAFIILLAFAYHDNDHFWVIMIIGMIFMIAAFSIVLLRIFFKHKEMPHSYRSHTRIVIIPRKEQKSSADNEKSTEENHTPVETEAMS